MQCVCSVPGPEAVELVVELQQLGGGDVAVGPPVVEVVAPLDAADYGAPWVCWRGDFDGALGPEVCEVRFQLRTARSTVR